MKQIARDNIRLDDKQLNKELARKTNNPYHFTDRILNVGFKINLHSHHINQDNSNLTFTPNFPDFGNEIRCINKLMKNFSVIYASLINQYKFKHQTVFAARFD